MEMLGAYDTLANKLVRIVWPVLRHGIEYNAGTASAPA
jgi:hypothetical protein